MNFSIFSLLSMFSVVGCCNSLSAHSVIMLAERRC
nr:MAG TPA: hypothetical protein [Bacteriophage sp.]